MLVILCYWDVTEMDVTDEIGLESLQYNHLIIKLYTGETGFGRIYDICFRSQEYFSIRNWGWKITNSFYNFRR